LIFDAVQWRLGVLAIMVKASATTRNDTRQSEEDRRPIGEPA